MKHMFDYTIRTILFAVYDFSCDEPHLVSSVHESYKVVSCLPIFIYLSFCCKHLCHSVTIQPILERSPWYLSDFYHIWHISKPLINKMKCKIFASKLHLFRDTAIFYLWGHCMLPADFISLYFLHVNISAGVLDKHVIISGLSACGDNQKMTCATGCHMYWLLQSASQWNDACLFSYLIHMWTMFQKCGPFYLCKHGQ